MNRWLLHVPPVSASPALRAWLVSPGSLTARLRAHCSRLDVRLLRQSHALCLPDQARAIGLAHPGRVIEREVLLCCDGLPVVYAQTVVPAPCSASDWPFFSALGSRSLGSALFRDPRIVRGALQHARLSPRHPLARRALALAPTGGGVLHARRCLYRRRHGLLLVTELFLPAIAHLRPRRLTPIDTDRQ
ncbi:MAG: chorismate lyase [Noviherbaspirillum sp.]